MDGAPGATETRLTTFVSYSSADSALARRLAQDLRRAGLDVWLDQWDLRVGEEIDSAIGRGVGDSDFMVVLLSAASVASAWVQREWQGMKVREGDDLRVLPVRCEECETPDYLAGRPIIDVSGGSYLPGLRHLLELIEFHSGRRLDRAAVTGSAATGSPGQSASERTSDMLSVVTPIAVEFSPELWPLFEGAHEGDSEMVNLWFPRIRTVIEDDLGVHVPSIRLRINSVHTPPGTFRIAVNEVTERLVELDVADVFIETWPDDLERCGFGPDVTERSIEGMIRLDDDARHRAEGVGVPTLAAHQFAVLVTYRTVRRMTAEWMTMDSAEAHLRQLHPHGDEATLPDTVSWFEFTDVLRRLLAELVPIIDMETIISTLAARDGSTPHVWQLVEEVRAALGALIVAPLAGSRSELAVLGLHPEIERDVEAAVSAGDGRAVSLDADIVEPILDAVESVVSRHGGAAFAPPILVRGSARQWIRRIVEYRFPEVAILSSREVPVDVTTRTIDTVDVADGVAR